MLVRNKLQHLVVLFILITTAFSLGNNTNAQGNELANNSVPLTTNGLGSNLVISPQVTLLQPHSPIIINGNADFKTQASSNGWDEAGTRDGSPDSPFVLSYLNITVIGGPDGLNISNTDTHFILSNGLFTGVIGWSAVNLKNVSNAVITENEVSFSSRGITINGGSNVAITNNNVHNNDFRGINLVNIQGMTVSGNSVSFTGAEAVVAESGAFNNIIRNNHIFNNSQGIVIWAGASGNQLLSNRIEFNSNEGIFVKDSANVVINANTLYFNIRVGVNLASGSSLARLGWNNFEWNNGGTEQFTDDGTGNLIELNYFSEFIGPDVDNNKIYDTPYVTISGQDTSPLVLQYTSTNPFFINLDDPILYRPVQLVWNNPTNSYNHSSSSSLYYSTNFGLSWTSAIIDLTSKSYLWNPYDITSGATVQLLLVSQTSENLFTSVQSNPFQLFDPILPSNPNNVIAGDNSGVVDLSWSTPNTFGTHNFTSYSVYRGSSIGALILYANTVNRWYNDSDVIPGMTYFYAISASSVAGEGNQSIPTSIQVLDTEPPSFTVDAFTDGINDLSGNVLIKINPTDNGEIDRVDIELVINGVDNLLVRLTADPYEFLFDTTTVEDGTYSITISVYDKSSNSVMVSYAITIENDVITISSSTIVDTTKTSSTTSTSDGDLPLPIDFISSIIGLISFVSLIFISRRIKYLKLNY
ncbi:MAG: hypothetical protein HeimC2_44600 [Candidatus Heimdallarchaeota archaeon LC_2]|nr:MAG: hypothetical protein HeimC2_44600 [Candidatus Heimdallarchaeota archaeon LC_2]